MPLYALLYALFDPFLEAFCTTFRTTFCTTFCNAFKPTLALSGIYLVIEYHAVIYLTTVGKLFLTTHLREPQLLTSLTQSGSIGILRDVTVGKEVYPLLKRYL